LREFGCEASAEASGDGGREVPHRERRGYLLRDREVPDRDEDRRRQAEANIFYVLKYGREVKPLAD
jgi:hypothetical protein